MFIVSLTCVFASENATVLNETGIEDSFNLSSDCEPDELSSAGQFNVTGDNVRQFFRGGTLNNGYSNAELFITEDMDGLGVLTVSATNVTINGMNHTLKDTVFKIKANDVTLNNITFIETQPFSGNDYAAVLIYNGDNVKLHNLNINVTAPRDSDAFGIYSEGSQREPITNLQIVNCTITLKGDNRGAGRDYALRLEYSPYARVLNSTINAEVSLRTVMFHDTSASLDSEFSLAVGVEFSDNLLFDGNVVRCTAGARPECAYPTLDAIFIGDSCDCNFTNNEVYLSDYLTYKDIPNYLYGLDIYRDDNLLVENNKFRVETTGGALAAGTAYPLQLTGPAEGIVIQYNDIYSKNNGPNIGIYSQNFNGANYITILNNYINVTGLAGNHSWALVAGIEAQDDNDIIMNNIIEVHNIQKVKWEDNIYGISYSQKTNSSHSYRVINNTVISDGYYLSYMLDAENTNVNNNTLVRTDKYADTNYDPFKRGDGIGADTDQAKNNSFSGNRVITIFEYDLEHQSNVLDGGEEFHYETPTNKDNLSNVINGSGISPQKPGFPGGNPLLPGNDGGGAFNTGGNNGGGFHSPDGDGGYNGWPDMSGDDGKSLSHKSQGRSGDTVNSFNNQGSSDNSYNNLVATSNSTSSKTPSVEGVTVSGASSSSSSSAGGAAGSSGVAQDDSKAYEITKNIVENGPDDMIKFIALAIVCEILLIIGYRRKETEDVTD
ncbi:right-handed parallel beta-helix repeat-containing protein [Methanobrevibacter thaueri]|uniref:Right handed beta helix domain-containing protein n=1 Tax=Methanobrevibacter thaueri TaxID=190975 RepID=A0A315XMK0_9EURY|nr:right-handed parallel beta-helix repeat-containing protein [Methanobrevibacter thaueri]PWB87545.1 hypothetical protein MBBTH_08130 [Methanobrevibacter thaueri]